MPRKLTVKKERLGELTTDDLHQVAAAGVATQQTLLTCASLLLNCQSVNYCTTAPSCGCEPSWNCQ